MARPFPEKDPGLDQFLEYMKEADPKDIVEKIAGLVADGDLVLRGKNGPIDPGILDLDTLSVTLPSDPESLSPQTEIGINCRSKTGEEVVVALDTGDTSNGRWAENPARVRRLRGGPPGMRGFLWPGELPPGPRKCPRCAVTWIPTNKAPGEYRGAMSRIRVGGKTDSGYATRTVEICSPCGTDEAMGRGIIPIEEWPVSLEGDFYGLQEQVSDAIKSGRLKLQNELTGEIIDPGVVTGLDLQVEGDTVTMNVGTDYQTGKDS